MKPQSQMKTIALYMAMSPEQLATLIRANWRRIDPGRDGEHFHYLKLNQCYAEMIARQWEVPLHGAGYVVRLVVPKAAMEQFELGSVAYEEHLEYCIPVCELDWFNRQILGEVCVVSAFVRNESYSIPTGTKPVASLLAWS